MRSGARSRAPGSMSARRGRSSARQTSTTVMSSPCACLARSWAAVTLGTSGFGPGRARDGGIQRTAVTCLHTVPVDVAHEGIHVRARLGTEVDGVGVLVHVECHDGYAVG